MFDLPIHICEVEIRLTNSLSFMIEAISESLFPSMLRSLMFATNKKERSTVKDKYRCIRYERATSKKPLNMRRTELC